MDNVVTAVLGGGQGSRLWPLTRDRAKPAVPLGGKFRLIDIPISNSLHAGIERIYVLTQFNSASLHRHISQTYRFDAFRRGFVNILAATQDLENRGWYQGTADAVRQNLHRLIYTEPEEVLILSGDQLYLMDVRAFVESRRATGADLCVAVCAVDRSEARSFGVMKVDGDGRIVQFAEKPQNDDQVSEFVAPREALETLGLDGDDRTCLASMGIYVFRPRVLRQLLEGTETTDFGREVLPQAIRELDVRAFGYPGYWRDIGTIPSFHEANLELTGSEPPLDLHSSVAPIFTRARFLPGTKMEACTVVHSLISDGGLIEGASIDTCVIGVRAAVGEGSVLERSILMGANTYEETPGRGDVALGVGRNCHVRNAILDLDTRIGDGSRLLNEAGVEHADHELYSIRGGIIVVPRGVTLPPGTVI